MFKELWIVIGSVCLYFYFDYFMFVLLKSVIVYYIFFNFDGNLSVVDIDR